MVYYNLDKDRYKVIKILLHNKKVYVYNYNKEDQNTNYRENNYLIKYNHYKNKLEILTKRCLNFKLIKKEKMNYK